LSVSSVSVWVDVRPERVNHRGTEHTEKANKDTAEYTKDLFNPRILW